MKFNPSMSTKTIVAVTLLATAAASYADDNDMAPGGDGYAFFRQDRPIVNASPSTFAQTNPRGLGITEYQSRVTFAPIYKPAPTIDMTPSKFAQTNPHGLSIEDYQAMSSEGPEFHPAPVFYGDAYPSVNHQALSAEPPVGQGLGTAAK